MRSMRIGKKFDHEMHVACRTLENRDEIMNRIPIEWNLMKPEQDDD